ncbi:MAG: hypothetical protein DRP85_09230, partial [Candidatus Makaraimicrobium thalassicum]
MKTATEGTIREPDQYPVEGTIRLAQLDYCCLNNLISRQKCKSDKVRIIQPQDYTGAPSKVHIVRLVKVQVYEKRITPYGNGAKIDAPKRHNRK